MHRGYVKLWRKSLDAGWIRNHKLWAFWTWCMMKASYREYDAIVGLQSIHLQPGQFIFGRRVAAEETGLSEREIRTCLELLKKAGNLTIKTTNKYSIITIVNWHLYQDEASHNGQQYDRPPTSKRPHTRSIKKEKKEEKSTFFPSEAVDIRENFLKFYGAYPRKVGKEGAWRAWQKIKRNGDLPPLEDLLSAIERQKKTNQWQDSNGKFIPHPATWLKDKRWEDTVEPETAAGSKAW